MSKHIKLERGKQLLSAGYSLIVAGEDKLPCHSWKQLMTKAWTVDELEKNIDNPKAFRYGYPTGFNDILVIDIDLKVLPMELRAPFFDEFIAFIIES